MNTIEVHTSDIIIQHSEIDSFNESVEVLGNAGSEAMLLLDFAVKPDFRDTPGDG